jgi:hypothetical protein
MGAVLKTTPREREQELIDLCFSMVIACAESVRRPTKDEVAVWVADKLRTCGFDTHPIGSSWGVLVEKNDPSEWS